MSVRALLWLSISVLLLCFRSVGGACQQCQVCNQCGQCPQNTIDYNVELTFETEGEESIVAYRDSVYGNLRVKVPRFFFNYTKERILKEIHTSFDDSAWSERVLLEIFYHAVTYGTDHKPSNFTLEDGPGLENAENWLNDNVDVCQWEGITCGPMSSDDNPLDSDPDYAPPCHAVTSIDLTEMGLSGTLPSELVHLNHLHRLNLNDNILHGTIPTEYGMFEHLRFMDLGDNSLEGSIPYHFASLSKTMQELWLEKNKFTGTIDYGLMELTNCRFMDLSENKLTGTIPPEVGNLIHLGSLFLENNKLNGTIATEMFRLPFLRVVDIGVNEFTGAIPTWIGICPSLIDFNVASNRLNGSIPSEIFLLTNLEVLILSENEITGILPLAGDDVPGRDPLAVDENGDLLVDDDDGEPLELPFSWSNLTQLVALAIDRNNFVGTFPPQLMWGLRSSLTSLDIGYNFFTGTLPEEIGDMQKLKRFTAPFNFLTGFVPSELERMKELKDLNLTSNMFTGEIPSKLCEDPFVDSLMAEEFGCDAFMCPPGTFSPSGAASMVGGCQPCPKSDFSEQMVPKLSTILGRGSCETARYLVGDQNVDGDVSQREALRFIYYQLNGEEWGDKYYSWRDLKVDECELTGITCNGCGEVSKIDLSEANVCFVGGKSNATVHDQCPGLPAEIKYLHGSLESLSAPRRTYLQGRLPSELGTLTDLKILDLQGCPLLTGTIPSEFGLLTNMLQLDLSDGSLNGTLPTEIFEMSMLEKINLSLNTLEGTLPSEIGNLKRLKELRISRAYLNGTLPSTLGDLRSVENLEIYGNAFSGSIPSELHKLKALKRIDLFNNHLTGPIPDALGEIKALQILHLKKNQLSGEIPSSLGELPFLVWLDASLNLLSGTIPETFGSSPMLKDLRLHGNRLYDPIPPSLCTNQNVNGGNTAKYGCDGIICPLGTFSAGSQGFAQDSSKCEKCPAGQTTLYLGSTECIELSQADLLSMLFDVLDGESWPDEFKKGWKEEGVSFCDWAGVTCNEKGEIIGLALPRSDRA